MSAGAEYVPVMRECLRPDCAAEFDVLACMLGRVQAAGWLQSTRGIPGYLCPRHSHVWSDGTHVVAWSRVVDGRPGSAVCSCGGWEWVCGAGTAGGMSASWAWHLVEAWGP